MFQKITREKRVILLMISNREKWYYYAKIKRKKL